MKVERKHLEALLTLRGSREFDLVIGLLKSEFESLKEELVNRPEDGSFRLIQGKCQLLREILEISADCRNLLDKYKR